MADLTLGFDEFAKEMEELSRRVANDEVNRMALEAMADPIVKEARRIIKGITRGNGHLEKEIVMQWVKNRPREIKIGWTNKGFYGRFLEDGYHHIGTLKFIKRPHIRPAYNAKIDEGLKEAEGILLSMTKEKPVSASSMWDAE